ncbi:YfiT family bacillithiol transferase [Flavobacterium sp. 7A]|uniref:YfiT family bacillithiol transferase n=1 Tax=Flavobacterium sp. 7A TaxID=2940571 RepID=UPI0022270338|nr:putative metal-dependent hydrolase [Flavobacterium sp. 7A]MCW2120123.1 hypothetical protein [Flavobacterium sp. 7A]
MTLEKLKYPIGHFLQPEEITSLILSNWIEDIARFPENLSNEVAHLSAEQLDTPYRPDGWTIRQVVHHCADSHMNSLTRFKLALTEDSPFIKPYHEERWAELEDSKNFPIQSSLQMLIGIHARWTALLKELSVTDLKRDFVHPEHGKSFLLDENIGVYAWHCNHHLAHITTLKKVKNWK